jgi:hypothetical protein
MQKSASPEIVVIYAQQLAKYFCDCSNQGWLGGDAEWDQMKGRGPLPPPGLSSSEAKLIRKATAFGAVAGRPETDPCSVQWCRDRLLGFRRAAKHYGLVEHLEVCFEMGYRTASSRSQVATPGDGDLPPAR